MGKKNLVYDLSEEPNTSRDYFIPLDLKLDPVEKDNFAKHFAKEYLSDLNKTHTLSVADPNVKEFFPKSYIQANDLLRPLGICARAMTLFASPPTPNIENTRNVHIDSTLTGEGEPAPLEARLSYYEMAEAPGIIRWYPTIDKIEETRSRINDTRDLAIFKGKNSRIFSTNWVTALRQRELSWEDAPDYLHSTTTSVPSALLRTNLPHNVIQGPGIRITVSCQLQWIVSRSPVDTWQHISDNY
jgi:hypothetical protein